VAGLGPAGCAVLSLKQSSCDSDIICPRFSIAVMACLPPRNAPDYILCRLTSGNFICWGFSRRGDTAADILADRRGISSSASSDELSPSQPGTAIERRAHGQGHQDAEHRLDSGMESPAVRSGHWWSGRKKTQRPAAPPRVAAPHPNARRTHTSNYEHPDRSIHLAFLAAPRTAYEARHTRQEWTPKSKGEYEILMRA